MKVSAGGRAAIRQREGCELTAYRDSRGILTIGVGHVNMTPPAVTPGMRITEAQADQFLANDLAPVEATINGAVKTSLTQNEFDALASLGFNIGVNGLRRCTVIGRLNRGDRAGAAQAFLLWAHPEELMGRRRAEMKQFQATDVEPARLETAAGDPVPAAPVTPIEPAKPKVIASASPAPAPVASPATKPAPGILSRIASLFVG